MASIYIENQYLTSVAVARALQQSLQQAKGPEIVLVLPRESSGWLDPERPVELDRIFDQFVHEEDGQSGKFQLVKISAVLLVLLALAVAWRWTPLSQWVSLEALSHLAAYLRDNPLLPLGVLAAFVVGGLTMVPITVLIGATGIIFPAHLSVVYALAGSLLSPLTTYFIGAGFGRQMVRKLAGSRLNRLSKRLARQGILTVAVVRNLPVAPFTIVNMVAGASHIKLRDFLLGTALGMLPGIIAITLFADRVAAAVKNPHWINIAVASGIALVLALGIWLAQKRLRPR